MYTDFFGFTENPFISTSEPKFLPSHNHLSVMEEILFGIREKMGLISLTGDVGTGKTTLLRFLRKCKSKKTEIISISDSHCNSMQLLQIIIWQLKIERKHLNKPELFQVLKQFLVQKNTSGGRIVLIIDEAHKLSNNILKEVTTLNNLEEDHGKLLQIVLVGQPELISKLNAANLRHLKQRITLKCHLTPLNHHDSKEFISFQLSNAGSKHNRIFSQNALNLICNHARGIPAVINVLAQNALLVAYERNLKTVGSNIIKEVITNYKMSGPLKDEKTNHYLHSNWITQAKQLLISLS